MNQQLHESDNYMRSTRQFLTTPYQASTKHNRERVEAVEASRAQAQLPPLLIPEDYLDAIAETIMQHPVDFSITEHDLIIVDLNTVKHARRSGNGHPFNREALKPLVIEGHKKSEPYLLVQSLANRIHAFVTIEELKCYVTECEEQRRIALLKELDGKSDNDAERILALLNVVSADEILRLQDVQMRDIPKHFFGDAPHSNVMTLPIILDGRHRIDFFDLVKTLPDCHHLTKEKLEKRALQARDYKAKRIASFIKERDEQIERLSTFRLEERNEHEQERFIRSVHVMHENKVAALQKMTEEDLFPTEAREYCNPFTGRPIESVVIDFKLLEEIDCFLDPFERQLYAVEKEFHRQERSLKRNFRGVLNGRSFSKLLEEEKYPVEKIPESLSLGRILGKSHLEVMTHPVLIDGEFWIDYPRLQEFWRPKPGIFYSTPDCRGINPFTKQPIKTIVYDAGLKYDTDRFVLNREGFKMLISPAQAQKGNYLRGSQFRTFPANTIRSRGFASLLDQAASIEDQKADEPTMTKDKN